MSDNDMIRRGDAKRAFETLHRTKHGYSGRGCDHYLTLTDATAKILDCLPAVQVTVRPLEWQSTVDGAGHDHGVTFADCPFFEKRFWAETPDKQAKVDAKRAARILSALTATPAPDAAKVAALVAYYQASEEIIAIEAEWRQRKSDGLLDGQNIFNLTDKLTAAETRLFSARAALAAMEEE